MTTHLSDSQTKALEMTERIASCLSLVGTTFVMITFVTSPPFRKPINRLIFYATLGNTALNVATLISRAGIRAGVASHLCQFQGFLIQMCLPADALWNLCMAINVYLTLFHRYNSQQLKALEWIYFIFCYGLTFVVALVYLFIQTSKRGKMYGDATLWCWIAQKWEFMRIALVYGPAWFCIIVSFGIYLLSGREIFRKRAQLRLFSLNRQATDIVIENPFTSYKTTEIHITSELAPVHVDPPANHLSRMSLKDEGRVGSSRGYDAYTVTIETMRMSNPPTTPQLEFKPPTPKRADTLILQRNLSTLEANIAAWGYTKCALLFFVSLLVTWVPSSLNRVYSVVHPHQVFFPFAYASGLVLPLMGFWNSLIYIVTSWTACKALWKRKKPSTSAMAVGRSGNLSNGDSFKRHRGSSSESTTGFVHDA